jgi:hypothetical protein
VKSKGRETKCQSPSFKYCTGVCAEKTENPRNASQDNRLPGWKAKASKKKKDERNAVHGLLILTPVAAGSVIGPLKPSGYFMYRHV